MSFHLFVCGCFGGFCFVLTSLSVLSPFLTQWGALLLSFLGILAVFVYDFCMRPVILEFLLLASKPIHSLINCYA